MTETITPSAGGCLGTGCGECPGCLACTHREVYVYIIHNYVTGRSVQRDSVTCTNCGQTMPYSHTSGQGAASEGEG